MCRGEKKKREKKEQERKTKKATGYPTLEGRFRAAYPAPDRPRLYVFRIVLTGRVPRARRGNGIKRDRTCSDDACSGVPHPIILLVFQVQPWVTSLTALFSTQYKIPHHLSPPANQSTSPRSRRNNTSPFTHRPTHLPLTPHIQRCLTSVRDKLGCESSGKRAPFLPG